MTSAESPSGPTLPELLAEVSLLRRLVQRERARRLAAEDIGERATADLFETVQQLRAVQAEILEGADRARVVNDLSRELRQIRGSSDLLATAARAIGQATLVDRCEIHVLDPTLPAHVWSDPAHSPPPNGPLDRHPVELRDLLHERQRNGGALVVEDVAGDPRVGTAGPDLVAELGARALVAAPMRVGSHFVGWLLLASAGPREWRERELAICEGLAGDLARTVLQVHTNEQQRESVRRLEELDRAKDAFVSNVSHELRTPLTSIAGYLELIAEGTVGPVSAELAHAVFVASRNTARLRSLVEDLLTMSAYDSRDVALDLSVVDVGQVLQECLDSLRPVLADRDLTVELRVAADLVTIEADRGQVERILTNLLSNAVKFTSDGGCVAAEVANADDAADGVAIVVRDTGIGIPLHEQDRLFTRFFRSSVSVTSHIKGTGLGLALVKTLVEQHGGTVDLESSPGDGTTVRVGLPGGRGRPRT